MHARAVNSQILAEFLCCSFFGGVVLYLVGTGKYLSYVTPRMEPYLYFTVLIMFLWSATELFRLVRPQYKVRLAHCLVLVIPILFLLLPHKPLSASEISATYNGGFFTQGNASITDNKISGKTSSDASVNNGADSESNINLSDNSEPGDSSGSASDIQSSGDQSSGSEIKDAGLSGFDPVNKTISVENDEFYQWISELYMNMDQYEGYTITMTGFVYKDPQYFAENEFMPARLCMTCCTADLTPIGLVCEYSNVSALKQNSWVTVEGVIHKGQYEGEDEPQISVTKIAPAEEVEGYVYPY